METIDQELRSIFEDERRAVTTPGTVVAFVTARIGRRRAGKLVEASAGTLAVIGLAAAVPFGLSHLGSPELAPGATPAVTPTYFMPANPLGLSCGDRVPPSLVSSSDRSEIEIYDTVVTSRPAPGITTKSWPVHSDALGAETELSVLYDERGQGVILADGGVVVGWTDDISSPSTVRVTISGSDERDGTTSDELNFVAGRILWCPAAAGDAQGAGIPTSGTYVTYPIVDPSPH